MTNTTDPPELEELDPAGIDAVQEYFARAASAMLTTVQALPHPPGTAEYVLMLQSVAVLQLGAKMMHHVPFPNDAMHARYVEMVKTMLQIPKPSEANHLH